MADSDPRTDAKFQQAVSDLWSLLRRAMDMADRHGVPFAGALLRSWTYDPPRSRDHVFDARDAVLDMVTQIRRERGPASGAGWLLDAFDAYCDTSLHRAKGMPTSSSAMAPEEVAAGRAARVRAVLDAVPRPLGPRGRAVVRVRVRLPGERSAGVRGEVVKVGATQITVAYAVGGEEHLLRLWNRPKDRGTFPAVLPGETASADAGDAADAVLSWGAP